MAELISCEYLNLIKTEERKSETLTKLPENFFKSVNSWLTQKRSSQTKKSYYEVTSAQEVLDEIINIRQKKIVMAALRTVRGIVPPPHGMLPEEQKFFDELIILMKNYRDTMREKMFDPSQIVEEKIDEIKSRIEEIKVEKPEIKNESVEIKQEKPEEKKAKDDGIEVKILKDLPKFVDEYEKYHGPFNAGQIVKVPRHVADMLLKSKSATPISNL